MGGKKGPEKNRKYEKDRRDRLNDQFNELNKLLPGFNSSTMKMTKTEIINRAIQYFKDNNCADRKSQADESDIEAADGKVTELQKKVAELLQIIKKLIKLLQQANINFPAALPVDDFVSFKEAYMKCKRKLKESSNVENTEKKTVVGNSKRNSSPVPEVESVDLENESTVQSVATSSSSKSITPSVSEVSTHVSKPQNDCSAQIMNVNSPNVLHVNTNPVIIPQGNLVTLNGLPNTILNTSPAILFNKQVTVPTLIVMQNSIVPVSTVQPISTSQQKLVEPKALVNTTKTTFTNKKPIPAVRLYKSIMPSIVNNSRVQLLKRKRCRRSKGILVKYPKRKPPSKNKKKEDQIPKMSPINPPPSASTDKVIDSGNLEPCTSSMGTYTESNDDISKNYTDNLFDTPDMQNTGQFIDFFENSARNVNTATDNVTPVAYTQNTLQAETNADNSLINAESCKEPSKDPESNKNESYLPIASFSSSENIVRTENTILGKRRCHSKETTPLTIECNSNEHKSVTKDLNLTFDDKSKPYESSFEEFTSDLFLHVPSSGHHADSISPTATFLSNFPLVSSFKTTDLIPEHEEDSNTVANNSTTILQIGNLGSPSTLLFTNKNTTNRDADKCTERDETYTFCNSTSELVMNRNDKKKEGKETSLRDVFSLDTFTSQTTKNSSCSKEPVTQNIPLYPTSTSSSISSYVRLSKYNDIPAVTSSYYSFSSSPAFSVSKTSLDQVTDYNSWVPTYDQEGTTSKERKREKPTSVGLRNTFGLPANEVPSLDKSKSKKSKQNASRTLVNWMTSPDSRNAPETLQPFSDIMFQSSKDDSSVPLSAFVNSPNVQSNSNFTSYPSTDFFLDGQSYGESQLSNKITYSSANPTTYSWSPPKTALPALSLDTQNMMIPSIPSTLPTLVGDLALGNNTFNNYESIPKKSEVDRKKNNYQKTPPQNASSFLSVTQLVDGKSVSSKKPTSDIYEENRDKCYKENYDVNKNIGEGIEFKKTTALSGYPSSTYKESAKRKETVKCHSNSAPTARCLSKENKKDNRTSQKLCDYTTSQTSCQMVVHKEANPLSNKNINYSAEALISSNNHSNTCSTQNYFSYDNSSSYNNCPYNKKLDETDSLANVGYYRDPMYANNFQTFNNFGISNQYGNNYPANQVPHTATAIHKKKDDEQQLGKQDSEWYKDNFSSSYSTIVPSELANQQKEKCKQSFSNKTNCGQKSSTMYTSYNQYSSSSKNNCNFNSTSYTFGQTGQHCSTSNCHQTSGYEMKSNRSLGTNSTNNGGMPPNTLTNFHMSTIMPEINDKQCMQSRISTVGHEKSNNFKYSAGNEIMNYNYLIPQATPETNSLQSASVYGSSNFQISHYPDFMSRKNHK